MSLCGLQIVDGAPLPHVHIVCAADAKRPRARRVACVGSGIGALAGVPSVECARHESHLLRGPVRTQGTRGPTQPSAMRPEPAQQAASRHVRHSAFANPHTPSRPLFTLCMPISDEDICSLLHLHAGYSSLADCIKCLVSIIATLPFPGKPIKVRML